MGDIENTRQELQDLDAILMRHRNEMRDLIQEVTIKLLTKADQLLVPMADEIEGERGEPRKRKIIIVPKTDLSEAQGTVTSGRVCGKCHKPGHNARTCSA